MFQIIVSDYTLIKERVTYTLIKHICNSFIFLEKMPYMVMYTFIDERVVRYPLMVVSEITMKRILINIQMY